MVQIQRARPDHAEAIVRLMAGIVEEGVHSAIDQAWSVQEQRNYLESLPARCGVFAAFVDGDLAGIQTLDLWAPGMGSMRHVAQLGTFLQPQYRGRGIGFELYRHTRGFAAKGGFTKVVIQVRGSNALAQRFYRRLGFEICGRLRDQVRIGGHTDDEVVMEMFL